MVQHEPPTTKYAPHTSHTFNCRALTAPQSNLCLSNRSGQAYFFLRHGTVSINLINKVASSSWFSAANCALCRPKPTTRTCTRTRTRTFCQWENKNGKYVHSMAHTSLTREHTCNRRLSVCSLTWTNWSARCLRARSASCSLESSGSMRTRARVKTRAKSHTHCSK